MVVRHIHEWSVGEEETASALDIAMRSRCTVEACTAVWYRYFIADPDDDEIEDENWDDE